MRTVMGVQVEDDREAIIISKERVASLCKGDVVFLTQDDKKKVLIPITWCCTPMKDIMNRKNGRKLVAQWIVCPYCGETTVGAEPSKATKPQGQRKSYPPKGFKWMYEIATNKRKVLLPGLPLPEGYAYLRKAKQDVLL
jgi:hypothetical protein